MKNNSEIKENEKKEKNLRKSIVENLIYLVVIFGSVFLINTFVMLRTEVFGPSMYPTLENGENLIVDKLTYQFQEPKRFDIVVFRYLYTKNRYYIKRIIGLPGETVQITDSVIYINGEPLEENYGYEAIKNAKRAAEPILLGENEYFVMGDNRNMSSDSRDTDVANVNRSQIIGRTFLRIWPLNRFGIIPHE